MRLETNKPHDAWNIENILCDFCVWNKIDSDEKLLEKNVASIIVGYGQLLYFWTKIPNLKIEKNEIMQIKDLGIGKDVRKIRNF